MASGSKYILAPFVCRLAPLLQQRHIIRTRPLAFSETTRLSVVDVVIEHSELVVTMLCT